MLVISSREFREHQKSYLDKVDEGLELLVQRGKGKAYKIVSVTEDDTLVSKSDFFAMIEKSLAEAREGKITRIDSANGLDKFLGEL